MNKTKKYLVTKPNLLKDIIMTMSDEVLSKRMKTRENFFDIMELNWSFLETEEDYVTVRDDLGNNWKIEVKVEE